MFGKIPSASETIEFYRSANVTSNVNTDASERHSKHPSSTPGAGSSTSLETSTEAADERTRTVNVTRPTPVEAKIIYCGRRLTVSVELANVTKRPTSTPIKALVPRKHIVDVDELSRTPNEIQSTPIEAKITPRNLTLRPLNILPSTSPEKRNFER